MTVPSLSTDALIIATIGIVFAYGIMAGHQAVGRLAASLYVGLVLASTYGSLLHDATQKGNYGGLNATQNTFQLILLIIPVVLIQLGHHRVHTTKHQSHIVVTSILSVLTSLLLISSIISQLDPVTQNNITSDSNLAAIIYNLRLWWLGLVPIAIAAVAFIKPKHH